MPSGPDYEYALSPTTQFYFCGVPFRLDTISICPGRCSYCFAMSRGGSRTRQVCLASHTWLRRKFDTLDAEKTDIRGEMLLHRVPIHFGGISDPFANRQLVKRSMDLLRVIRDYDYPVIISTKSTTQMLRTELIDLLRSIKYLMVQVPIGAPSDEFASFAEPYMPSVSDRIRCIAALSGCGIHTAVRLQPLLVPWIEPTVAELVGRIGDAKCKHVVVEFLKLPVERKMPYLSRLFRRINWDGAESYRRLGAQRIGREWVLPAPHKWELLQPLISTIRRHGMTYGSADYGLNHLGDTACCCGVSELPGFSNWFKGNIASVIRESKTGPVLFEHMMCEWLPQRSMRRYMNSHCRMPANNSMECYLRQKWNSPGSANAPDALLGISWTGERDGGHNCIYQKESVA